MPDAELIERPEDLDSLRSEWDELAVRAERPYCGPAWLLAWWRHLRPSGASLRTAIVRANGQLVAIAPFFAPPEQSGFVEYRLLGAATTSRIGPVAVPGEEARFAPSLARALAGSRPRLSTVRLEGIDAGSPWPALLAGSWPSRRGAWLHHDLVFSAPTLTLDGTSFENWFASKSRNFRSEMRRKRRKLEAEGGRLRITHTEQLGDDLRDLARLHYARWEDRGGSDNLSDAGERMLREVADELFPQGRFRLLMADVEGRAIAAELLFEAGGGVVYWGGGFDSEWARFSPSGLLLLMAVEDAIARGDRHVDFGHGTLDYKRRFADGDQPLGWFTIFPRSGRYPLARARTLRRHTTWRVRAWAQRRLKPSTRTRLKRLLRR
jgi:CelD/BcsL family acetyltransferase involved in cellulose biosynthesis